MQEIRKKLELTRNKYYETHLLIVNPILPNTKIKLKDGREINQRLTSMEVTVLAAFMSLDINTFRYRFNPDAKKYVMQELQLSPAGLSNYITSLTDKGFYY